VLLKQGQEPLGTASRGSVPRVSSVMGGWPYTRRGDPRMLLDSWTDLYREVRRNAPVLGLLSQCMVSP
jgi:hypothetical protein